MKVLAPRCQSVKIENGPAKSIQAEVNALFLTATIAVMTNRPYKGFKTLQLKHFMKLEKFDKWHYEGIKPGRYCMVSNLG